MNADGSGGGTPGQQHDHAPTPASDEPYQSVDELFSAETKGSASTGWNNDAHPEDLDQVIDALDEVDPADEGSRSPRRRMILGWTVLTVTLAFLVAALFTVLSLQTESQLAAFSAGLMVGIGGLFIGLGTLLDRDPKR